MIDADTDIEYVICDDSGPCTAVETAEQGAKLLKWYQAKYPKDNFKLFRVVTITLQEEVPVY